MVVALSVPGREVLLHFTAVFFADSQHVVCIGIKLEGVLSSLLPTGNHDYAESVTSFTSEAYSEIQRDHNEDAMSTVSSLSTPTEVRGMTSWFVARALFLRLP